MGVDVSHIIKHDFWRVEDEKASRLFVESTIEQLRKNLLFLDHSDKFSYLYDEEFNETTFRLPFYDVEFILHNGFWQIESYYHYCQIVMHPDGQFWLRQLIFDIARALGQEEAWHAEEYYTWNGGGCEYPEVTFSECMEWIIKKYGKNIPEFNPSAFLEQGNIPIPAHEPIYHDSFKDCKQQYDTLQAKLKNYNLLGLSTVGHGKFLRCEKDGQLFLVNKKTLKPLFDKPIQGVLHSLNGPEFVVKNNGLSAVFDANGIQLTEFVKGKFEYDYSRCSEMRIIYNKEAGIELEPR